MVISFCFGKYSSQLRYMSEHCLESFRLQHKKKKNKKNGYCTQAKFIFVYKTNFSHILSAVAFTLKGFKNLQKQTRSSVSNHLTGSVIVFRLIPVSLNKEMKLSWVKGSTCKCCVFTFVFKGGRGADFQDRNAPGGHKRADRQKRLPCLLSSFVILHSISSSL